MASRRLSSVNLNQLVALDTLLDEGSVTRAAHKIGVTQSALSHTLAALRDLLGDPLLVRESSGMVLSDRAKRLSGPLRRNLAELERILSPEPSFDPATTERDFRLATEDFIAARVAAHLVPEFKAHAPHASLTIRPLTGISRVDALLSGEIDVLIGPTFDGGVHVQHQPWCDEPFACVVRRGHPQVGDTLDLETYVALGHVLVSPTGRGTAWVDQGLAERGLARRVVFRAPSFLMAPMIVASSDVVLTAPVGALQPFVDAFGLRQLPPPLPLAPLPLSLSWHRRNEALPAQQWFRTLLREAAS
ncbi:MAG: LysR family transcriptional regulator [Myxococcota bacterium]